MNRVGGGERCGICDKLVAYGELHWTDDPRHNALAVVKAFECEASEAQNPMEGVVLRSCARRIREAVTR